MAKAARKKGASRNTRASSGRKGVPGWLWLALGLALGLFTALLWHLWDLRQAAPARTADVAAEASPDKGSAASAAGKPAAEEETKFEFYTLLPSQEVMPGKGAQGGNNQAAAKSGEAQYVLQAGSFKSEAEADKRRANILMLGLPVKVARVPGKAGETWYRIVVGPFTGKAAAQSARENLRSNGVESIVIKQG